MKNHKTVILLFGIFTLTVCSASPGSKLIKDPNEHRSLQVFQLDKNTNLEKLKLSKNYIKDIPEQNIVNRGKRDQFLVKFIGARVEQMDELDRDLFVRRLDNYKKSDFIKKYPDVSKNNQYSSMKKAWRNE